METILGMSASFSSLFILSFFFLNFTFPYSCVEVSPHPFHPNPLYIIVLVVQYTFTTMRVFQDPGKETTAACLYSLLEVKKSVIKECLTLVYLSCSPALPPLIVALLWSSARSSPFLVGFSLFHIQNHENIHIYIGQNGRVQGRQIDDYIVSSLSKNKNYHPGTQPLCTLIVAQYMHKLSLSLLQPFARVCLLHPRHSLVFTFQQFQGRGWLTIQLEERNKKEKCKKILYPLIYYSLFSIQTNGKEYIFTNQKTLE